MDNYLPLKSSLFNADDRHMRIELTMLTQKEKEGDVAKAQVNFFSATTAFSHLLVNIQLGQIDPKISYASGLGSSINASIARTDTSEILGTYFFNRPGHAIDWSDPGIYLTSVYDSQTLRQLTGLPFPDNDPNNERLILLANYNKDFSAILPLPIYHTLLDAATAYLQRRQADQAETPHALVVGGQSFQNPVRSILKAGQDYTECHYYPMAAQAALHLLNIDMRKFLPAVDGQKHNHQRAYLKDMDGHLYGAINIMPIDDSPHGNPPAGIWLHSPDDDISLLQQRAGIDLSAAPGYDSELPMILVAPFIYEYEFGYDVRLVPGMDEFVSMLNETHQPDGVAAQDFTVNHHYALPWVTDDERDTSIVRDYFHYPQLISAIERLLQTEVWLLGLSLSPVEQHSILDRAFVDDSDGSTVALLQVQVDENERRTVSLIVLPIAENYEPALFSQLRNLWGPDDSLVAQPPIITPILDIDKEGNLQWDPNFTKIIEVLESQKTQQSLASNDKADALSQQVTPKTITHYIDLNWSGAAANGQMLTRMLEFSDVATAHNYLLKINDNFFFPHAAQPGNAYLQSATLRQGNDNVTIAKRFYQPLVEGHSTQVAGIFVQYAAGIPHADVLAEESRVNGFLDPTKSETPGMYRQIGKPATKGSQSIREQLGFEQQQNKRQCGR